MNLIYLDPIDCDPGVGVGGLEWVGRSPDDRMNDALNYHVYLQKKANRPKQRRII